jgi:RNA polymerase sigma factor (sigma-70 family)
MYDRYFGFCIATAYRYVQSYDKAADVTHNALVKVFRHFDRFVIRDHTHLEAMVASWIKKIVTYAAIDYLRKQARGRNCYSVFAQEGECPDESRTADKHLLYKELVALVDSLPPAYQRVFSLYVIEGYSHPEIARMLSISSGTSKSNLSKARTYLQKLLKQGSSFNFPKV